MAPHAFDAIVRHLGVFSAVSGATGDRAIKQRLDAIRSTISGVLQGAGAALVIVSGPQDGTVLPLDRPRIAIGREDPERKPPQDPSGELVLAAAYTAVTRISHPHAVVSEDQGQWYIEDCGSTGGTVVNSSVLMPHRKLSIRAGDLIELGKGPSAARLSFIPLQQE
jgi:pSer/pThr/pTyr-binding forkhead associated (FHA) protein